MAESIFAHLVKEAKVEDHFRIDSAGTGGWHTGEPPDERTIRELKKHGIDWASRARMIKPTDVTSFDLILPMDRKNEQDLLRAGAPRDQVKMMMSFAPDLMIDEVPDPYYGGSREFRDVYEMLVPACESLLTELLKTQG